MFRLYVAFGLAVAAGLVTAISGLWQDLGTFTLSYRTLISIVIFGAVGFFFGGYAEVFVRGILETALNPKGQNIDITSKDSIIEADELINPSHAQKNFSPLTPNDFEHFTVKE